MGNAGPIGLTVVELGYINTLYPLSTGIHTNRRVDPILQGYHQTMVALFELLHSQIAIRQRHHAIERIGGTGAHQVGQLLLNNLDTGDLLQCFTHNLTDPTEFLMAIGIFLAILNHLTAEHTRPLRDDHDGVVARVRAAILNEQACETLDIERNLTYECTIGVG